MPKIVQYPHSALKEVCSDLVPGSEEARSVIADLKAAIKSTGGRRGVGLSAPQIAVTKRVFVIDADFLKVKCSDVFVNPEIILRSTDTDEMVEECLSLPAGVGVSIVRPVAVSVRAYNAGGTMFDVWLTGLAARCVQHEIDHLNGISLLEHMTPNQKREAMKKIVKAIKKRGKRG